MENEADVRLKAYEDFVENVKAEIARYYSEASDCTPSFLMSRVVSHVLVLERLVCDLNRSLYLKV